MSWIGWQIDYLLLWQSFRELTHGFFDQFFLLISQAAVAPFTVMMMCVIYWCINKKLGIYMMYCNALSLMTNIFLKFTFCIYRPWILDPRIQPTQAALDTAPGYSFPSGHTAGAVSLWGALGMYFKNNKFLLGFCALIVFLVMVSRNYLGVHTSQDVIVSLIVGVCILFLVQEIMKKTETKKDFDVLLLFTVACLCIVLAMYLMLKSYPADYVNGVLLYDNTDAKFKAFSHLFEIFAIFLGCFLEARFIKFNPAEISIIKRIFIAVFGLILLYFADSYLCDILSKFVTHRFAGIITDFTIGLYITFLYPLFIKTLYFLKSWCYK